MRKCANCGSIIPDNYDYCPECGETPLAYEAVCPNCNSGDATEIARSEGSASFGFLFGLFGKNVSTGGKIVYRCNYCGNIFKVKY